MDRVDDTAFVHQEHRTGPTSCHYPVEDWDGFVDQVKAAIGVRTQRARTTLTLLSRLAKQIADVVGEDASRRKMATAWAGTGGASLWVALCTGAVDDALGLVPRIRVTTPRRKPKRHHAFDGSDDYWEFETTYEETKHVDPHAVEALVGVFANTWELDRSWLDQMVANWEDAEVSEFEARMLVESVLGSRSTTEREQIVVKQLDIDALANLLSLSQEQHVALSNLIDLAGVPVHVVREG